MKAAAFFLVFLSGFFIAVTSSTKQDDSAVGPEPFDISTTADGNSTDTSTQPPSVSPPQPPPSSTTIKPTSPTTTASPNTTSSPNTTTSSPNTTTTIPSTTSSTSATTVTPKPEPSTNGTTLAPTVIPTSTTTAKPMPAPDRRFDAPSFIGGFVLALGLVAIAFVSWKFYASRQESVYHTL